jgi:capsular polysaccharide biosynthesis protein
MSGDRPADDLGAEREIDLGRLRAALAARVWIVVAGLVAGLIVGGLYSLSGGSSYKASTLIAPGQPLSPGGQPVLTYQSSPTTIGDIATSEAALKRAAAAAHMPVGELRGHVTTATVSTGLGASTSRAAVLIRITVELHKPKRAEDAANALARIIQHDTTSIYVTQSIATYKAKLDSYTKQLAQLAQLISHYNSVIDTQNLDPLNKLVLVSQLDNAVQRQGNLNDKQATVQDTLTLAETIEIAQIVEKAVAAKTVARSRRNSILVGALIGLLLGGIAAIAIDSRGSRARPA